MLPAVPQHFTIYVCRCAMRRRRRAYAATSRRGCFALGYVVSASIFDIRRVSDHMVLSRRRFATTTIPAPTHAACAESKKDGVLEC